MKPTYHPAREVPQVNWKPNSKPKPDTSWRIGVRIARARRAAELRKLQERESRAELQAQ